MLFGSISLWFNDAFALVSFLFGVGRFSRFCLEHRRFPTSRQGVNQPLHNRGELEQGLNCAAANTDAVNVHTVHIQSIRTHMHHVLILSLCISELKTTAGKLFFNAELGFCFSFSVYSKSLPSHINTRTEEPCNQSRQTKVCLHVCTHSIRNSILTSPGLILRLKLKIFKSRLI